MKRLLIANRGEIALRILRAARDLGLETVVVFTTEDRNLPYLHLADQAVCIDKSSYLNMDAIISAALSRDCDAIHPGYGFLSENTAFAQRVEDHNLIFVGPRPADIALMADKSAARQHMADLGIDTVPGSHAPIENIGALQRVCREVGYPVMLKASHGGGGRGIRLVNDERALQAQFAEAQTQAGQLFGDDSVYVEKYLPAPKHIELQVAGDGLGSIVMLGARDCSIQRSHQKLLEESPPPVLDMDKLSGLETRCHQALAEIQYRNLGTLEFLYDKGSFYFIEMNTRLQVEHPVTEAVTGIDLVKLQLEIAAGEAALDAEMAVVTRGHAIECRINAEDEAFIPAPGPVDSIRFPGGPGVRMDTHLAPGYQVPHAYDSLVAKLICHGDSREVARRRMIQALTELEIRPLKTNTKLHQRILKDERFVAGEYSTQFINALEPVDNKEHHR